jgi:hypothetical protein
VPQDIVAEHRLVARRAGGEPFRVQVVIRKPAPSVRVPDAWGCEVTVDPICSRPFEVLGEGSLQALCLGAAFAMQVLDTFVQKGGRLEYPEGGDFDPGAFGVKLPPMPDGEGATCGLG